MIFSLFMKLLSFCITGILANFRKKKKIPHAFYGKFFPLGKVHIVYSRSLLPEINTGPMKIIGISKLSPPPSCHRCCIENKNGAKLIVRDYMRHTLRVLDATHIQGTDLSHSTPWSAGLVRILLPNAVDHLKWLLKDCLTAVSDSHHLNCSDNDFYTNFAILRCKVN